MINTMVKRGIIQSNTKQEILRFTLNAKVQKLFHLLSFGIIVLSLVSPDITAQPSDPIQFTSDGAWCWFQDPRAVYISGEHNRTYAQWVTKEGRLQVGLYDHDTKSVELETIKENWDADDHNVGAFIVLEDNRLMLFYARHNKEGLFCRTSTYPENIHFWEEEVEISNTDRITYAHPFFLSEESRFYVFWRGPSWKPTFSTSEDGIQWSTPRILLQDPKNSHNSVRPYTKIVSDGKSTFHVAFTDGHPRNEEENSIYYISYSDGLFKTADGKVIGEMVDIPLNPADADIVYDANSSGIRSWVWDIAVDPSGNPVVAYTRLPSPNHHIYHLAYSDGTVWRDLEVSLAGGWFPETPAGKEEREKHYSGGISLNQENPFIVYLSRPFNGTFEISRAEYKPNQGIWLNQELTSKSKHNNIRPLYARGAAPDREVVLWMSGSYIHWTDFNTGIYLFEIDTD